MTGELYKQRRVVKAQSYLMIYLKEEWSSKVTYNVTMNGYCKVRNLEEDFKLRRTMRNDV